MKIGIKIFPDNRDYLKEISGLVDFVEVMAVETEDFGFMGEHKIPYIIHNEHSVFGVNLSDPERRVKNLASIRFSQGLADRFGAMYIIVHPGKVEGERCSLENVIKVIEKVGDKRVIIENLPFNNLLGGLCFGSRPKEIERIMKATGCGFNLDFAHACAAADSLGRDHVEFVREFIKLKPVFFHISDGNVGSGVDKHLHLGQGNLDLKAFRKMIPGMGMVTIETWPEFEEQIKDIGFMRSGR